MPDTEAPLEDQGWFDHFLKKIMPNGTVMRRYIAAAFICGFVFGIVAIKLIDRTDANTVRGTKAICAIIEWGEATLDRSTTVADPRNAEAQQRFSTLIHDMRATGVKCSPR